MVAVVGVPRKVVLLEQHVRGVVHVGEGLRDVAAAVAAAVAARS